MEYLMFFFACTSILWMGLHAINPTPGVWILRDNTKSSRYDISFFLNEFPDHLSMFMQYIHTLVLTRYVDP